MNIIAERIIAYLKTNAALVALLGSSNNIHIMGLDQREPKRIVISGDIGSDGNNIPSQTGDVEVQIVVSREIASAPNVCLNIAQAVDDLLNKSEVELTSGSWKVISFIRQSSPGIQIDGKDNEYWLPLEYSFILDEST